MAKVIFRLWNDDNKDLMILPGSLPLYDGSTRNELVYYLPAGWEAVVAGDIGGGRAERARMENKEPRFGQVGRRPRRARGRFPARTPATRGRTARICGRGG